MFRPTANRLVRAALLGALAVAATGCGINPGVQYDAYGNVIDPYGYGSGYGSDYGSDYGSGGYSSGYGSDYGSAGGYTNGISTGGTYGGYPVTAPSAMPVETPQLRVGKLNKDTKGILLWKKLTVEGQITNPTQTVLSGEITISFMKKDKVVETQTEFVTDLAPGQAHSFTLTSKKSADDAQVSVLSQPGQAPAGGYSNGTYGSGSSGYGTGSYGSGSSYGSGYGSGGSYGTGY